MERGRGTWVEEVVVGSSTRSPEGATSSTGVGVAHSSRWEKKGWHPSEKTEDGEGSGGENLDGAGRSHLRRRFLASCPRFPLSPSLDCIESRTTYGLGHKLLRVGKRVNLN